MKLYYAYEGSKVTSSVQEDYSKIEDWKLIHPNWILQDEVSRENEVLKVVDGIVVLKTDEDLKQEILPICDNIRNKITENNIFNGFDWPPSNGVRFYLSNENQMNFTNLFLMSKNSLVSYPKTVWSGIETFQLQSAQDVEDFYLSATNHVELQLNQGLLAKQAFRTMTYTELKNWIKSNSNF